MNRAPERELVTKLHGAAAAVADGADDALHLIGPLPDDPVALEALPVVERTAVRALLKAVEQQQDILARLFRTYLAAEAVDVVILSGRDVANMMEKYGALADAYVWSDLTRLRNRLAHEYPVEPEAQLKRVREAAEAVPTLRRILNDLTAFLSNRGYLP